LEKNLDRFIHNVKFQFILLILENIVAPSSDDINRNWVCGYMLTRQMLTGYMLT